MLVPKREELVPVNISTIFYVISLIGISIGVWSLFPPSNMLEVTTQYHILYRIFGSDLVFGSTYIVIGILTLIGSIWDMNLLQKIGGLLLAMLFTLICVSVYDAAPWVLIIPITGTLTLVTLVAVVTLRHAPH